MGSRRSCGVEAEPETAVEGLGVGGMVTEVFDTGVMLNFPSRP